MIWSALPVLARKLGHRQGLSGKRLKQNHTLAQSLMHRSKVPSEGGKQEEPPWIDNTLYTHKLTSGPKDSPPQLTSKHAAGYFQSAQNLHATLAQSSLIL